MGAHQIESELARASGLDLLGHRPRRSQICLAEAAATAQQARRFGEAVVVERHGGMLALAAY
jgi:hypothetical protein